MAGTPSGLSSKCRSGRSRWFALATELLVVFEPDHQIRDRPLETVGSPLATLVVRGKGYRAGGKDGCYQYTLVG